ncbi:AI-2E family transporter [Natronomonas halophila]|uniref:AI-2E family transporter n=1 Tax=Natronomonas halophila TaxID=2747817 RepID=UPI0015B6143E|nr:AI-2E family transporter [Natronomonas halophila]QLD85797.1 AI-2E family transporter [Natronomonas halophila]
MSSLRRRRYVLAGLLVGIGLIAVGILWAVVETVFFAITVAYVLYPLRQRLVDRSVPNRIASGIVTMVAFVAVVVLLAPIAWTLFRRRSAIIELLGNLPDELPIEAFGFTYVVDVVSLVNSTSEALRELAFSIAADSVFITLQLTLFTIVLYGLLLRPNAVGRAAFEITPPSYHDVIRALHNRIGGTLYALYIIQAATAVLTFPVALVVFFTLGYDDVFVLAVLSAILQFFPIVGPGMLAIALGGYDFLIGMTDRAIAVIVLGTVVIGVLPDILIRPRLATRQANLPASLYFVGFVGGVLTVGVIGIIAGPLIVALLVEMVDLLSERSGEIRD